MSVSETLLLESIVPQTVVGELLGLVVIGVVVVAWGLLAYRNFLFTTTVFLSLVPLWVYLKRIGVPLFDVFGVPILPTVLKELLLVAAFLGWFADTLIHEDSEVVVPVEAVVFFAVVLLVLTQASPRSYLPLLRPYVEMFLLVSIPLMSHRLDRSDVEYVLGGVVLGGVVTALAATVHMVVDPQLLIQPELLDRGFKRKGPVPTAYFGSRLQSFTGNPNVLGRMMLLSFLPAFGLSLKRHQELRRFRQFSYLCVALLAAFVLLQTESRDDIVVLALGTSLFVLTTRWYVAGVTLAGFVGTGLLLGPEIVNSFRILLSQGNPRITVWRDAISYFGLDLLVGQGTISSAFNRTHPFDSTYLRLLIQTGALGVFTFLLFNYRLCVSLFRESLGASEKYLRTTILACLAVFMVGFSVQVDLFIFPFTLYYWTFAALGVGLVYTD